MVSKLCSAAMLLPCAATCPSVVARAAAVARGAIAGASALLSSFEASSACDPVAHCCRRLPCSPPGPLLVRRASERGR